MDTRFWGPSGWELLHLISYNYPKNPSPDDKINYGIFYMNLKDVLPCKYCRRSFTKYINNLPIDDYLESRDKLIEWVYLIHNKVNGKLRRQGLLNTQNPSLEEVNQKYEPMLKKRCQLPGWDFIYSIVFNYSEKDPNPEKVRGYLTLFTYLGKVIPCPEYRKLYNKFFEKDPVSGHLTGRDKLIKWIYQLNCKINSKFKEPNKDFSRLCGYYEKFRAGSCSKKNHKGKTCRKKKLPKQFYTKLKSNKKSKK